MGVDFAAGCTYSTSHGGPGSPAFAYVAARHLDEFRQPIWGWMGRHNPFEMEQGYVPAKGIRRVISGTPIIRMPPIQDSIDPIAETGMPAAREKSVALTDSPFGPSTPSITAGRGRVIARDPEAQGELTSTTPTLKPSPPALWAGRHPRLPRPDGIQLGRPCTSALRRVLAEVSAVAAQLRD